MNTTETPNLTTTKTFNRRAVASRCLAATAAAIAILPPLTASAQTNSGFDPHFDALVNLEFANEYVTPRGMIVTDRGLTFQPLLLGLLNVYKGDTFISDVTLVPGVWNDFSSDSVSVHAPGGTKPMTDWVETDPIMGFSFSFAKKFKLEVTYTAFNMHVLDIGTSQHLDTKLSYDDSDYLKKFALHPYFEYWQELENKATDADVPGSIGLTPRPGAQNPEPGSSYYFEVGVDPGYTFDKAGGLKLEAPCRVLLPNSRFYGDFYAPSSTVGLFEIGGKASMPMAFMPNGLGHWGVHGGVKYLNFVDDNLYHLNEFNQPGRPVRSTVQVFAGMSIFF